MRQHAVKAIAIDDFGDPPSLNDLPVPSRLKARRGSGSRLAR
jgi:hypothetical protein